MTIADYVLCEDRGRREDYESHIFANVWWAFTAQLPTEEDWENDDVNVWYYADADEILCRNEYLAEQIANILEAISGEYEAETGYYDPVADEEDDCADGRTGWYFVRRM